MRPSHLAFQIRTGWALATSIIFVAIIRYFWEGNNPDWIAYQRIYDGAGAWLADSGRDAAFILITEIYKWQPLLPTDYHSFRIFVSLVFVIFWFMVTSGRLICFPSAHTFAILLPVLSLILLRGTVQIREGISVVIFFLTLRIFISLLQDESRLRYLKLLATCVAAFFSSGTHFAGFFAIAIFLYSYLEYKLAGRAVDFAGFIFTPLMILLIATALIQTSIMDAGLLYAQSISGDRFVLETGLTLREFFVWVVFLILSIFIWISTSPSSKHLSESNKVFRIFARNLAGPVSITGSISIIVLKANYVSPLATVLLVRTTELSASLSAVLVTMIYGKRVGAISMALFLISKSLFQIFRSSI